LDGIAFGTSPAFSAAKRCDSLSGIREVAAFATGTDSPGGTGCESEILIRVVCDFGAAAEGIRTSVRGP